MKASKFFNVAIGIIFIVAISVPLIGVNKTAGKISVAENRVLAGFPDFKTPQGSLNTNFIKGFELWFNDNLGLRDKLVMINTKLQYNLFGTLTKADTMVGKNEWLYYVNSDIIKDFQHLNLPSDEDLQKWGNSLVKINRYLLGEKISFITMLNLDKKSIYPENYPDSINQIGNVSRTDMIEGYFQKETSLDFFTTQKALTEAKAKATVYSPRYDNAHWNYYGSFIGYLELMKKVKHYYPSVKVLSWDDFNITKYNREAKVYNAIPFSEEDYGLNYNKTSTAVRTYGLLDNLNLIYSNEAYTYSNSNRDLPKALIFGDSYFYGFLIPQLAESFSELTFIHTDNIDRLQSLVNLTNPDIVVYENVERMWDHTMGVLENSTELMMNYHEFSELPKRSEAKIWIDYFDNEPLAKQGEFVLKNENKTVNIIGWALDPKSNSVASGIYLKVGDKYYSASYGIARESVANSNNNSDLTNSGFAFNVRTSDLINVKKVSLIVISKDKTYQYYPLDIKVKVK